MKKLFLFLLLYLFAFSTKAQEMNFEETAKYIQQKYNEYNADAPNSTSYSFTAFNNGDIEGKTNGSKFKFNLFNLTNNTLEGTDKFGIKKYNEGSLGLQFYSYDKYLAAIYFTSEFTMNGLERIYKALIHLRSLCTKEKDPFDN